MLALVGSTPNSLPEIETVFTNLLGSVTSVIGLAIFIVFIVGAFQYLFAGSNEENAQKAKQTFTFAALGGAALILLYFVFLFIRQFTGLDVLKFKVCITGSGPFCQ